MAQITLICKHCNNPFIIQYKYRNKRKFCCQKCSSDYFSGKNNPWSGKRKETNPEWAEKIRKTCIERKINVGDKNAMKRKEVAEKMSKTRREKVTSNPEYRKARSESSKKAWIEGKYENVSVGKCKWYYHTKPSGEVIKLQGTWEVVYAQFLDKNRIEYLAHVGRLTYFDSKGLKRSYYPDFYLIESKTYIDIKGVYFYENCSEKFKYIQLSNPDLKIKMFTKENFNELGIDIVKESNIIRVNNSCEQIKK